MYGTGWLMNSSFCHAVDKFYSGAVTVREAGKCSASVSHRSDSASMCAAQRQLELLWFHLDHSSLPRTRMLKLTGLSFSSSASCLQALFSSSSSVGPLLAAFLSHRGRRQLLCSFTLFSFPFCTFVRLRFIVLSISSSQWLPFSRPFFHSML